MSSMIIDNFLYYAGSFSIFSLPLSWNQLYLKYYLLKFYFVTFFPYTSYNQIFWNFLYYQLTFEMFFPGWTDTLLQPLYYMSNISFKGLDFSWKFCDLNWRLYNCPVQFRSTLCVDFWSKYYDFKPSFSVGQQLYLKHGIILNPNNRVIIHDGPQLLQYIQYIKKI